MKRNSLIAAIIAVLFITLASFSLEAKNSRPGECLTCQLDATYLIVPGQRGFYQLTDEEGGTDKAFGRKCPAIVSGLEVSEQADGRFTPIRNDDGTITVCVTVFRPATKGGSFDKCAVAYGSRYVGGFDIIQPGDLTGF
jgi:hypothetical protein